MLLEKRKVLFLIGSLQFGGAEKQTVTLLNNLQDDNLEVHLAYFVVDGQLHSELNHELIAGSHSLDKKSRFDFMTVWRLYQLVKRLKIDTIVCVSLYPGFFAHCVKLIFRTKFDIFLILHSTKARNNYEELIIQWLYLPLINRSDRLVFVCHNQMEYWVNHYKVKSSLSSVIYNGIDSEFYVSVLSKNEKNLQRFSLGYQGNEVLICICAALRPEKRHCDLLDAFSVLIKKGLPVKLLMVGEGSERKAIEAKILSLDLSNSVHITGFQDDIRPFIEISDICCLSSATETFSIAMLEAMSLAKPVVGPRVGGVPEQVIDGLNGLTYPVGDIVALAEALESLVKSDRLQQMGRSSRERVETLFTYQKMVASYINLLTADSSSVDC